ncbi:MAG: glycosyltransferase family 39 protein [Coleofasciculaceae cyanobacterium]
MNVKTQNLVESEAKVDWFKPWIPITLILLLAAALYLYHLGRESCWLDELYSIRDVKDGRGLPPHNLVRPLYYMFLSVWIQFGTSDTWLRGLAVIFALGSVFLTYLIGRRLVNEPEGLIAALLLAISPLFINHAQEVRMYTMSTCLGLAGTLAAIHALERPTNFLMGCWASLRFLAIITVPFNVTLLVPDVVLVWFKFHKQRRILLAFGKWLVLIGLLWAPCVLLKLVPSTAEFASYGPQVTRPAPGVVEVVRLLRPLTVWPFRIEPNSIASWFNKLFTPMLVVLMGMGLIHRYRSGRLLWVVAWGVLPLAQIFVASNLFFSLWLERYLLFTFPYLLIILAAGFMRVWRQGRAVAIIVALTYILGAFGGLVHYYTVQERTDYRGIVQTIKTNEKPDDVVVWSIESWIKTLPLVHYDHGSAPVHVPETVLYGEEIGKQDVENWLSSLPETGSRLWLVCKLSENQEQMFIDLVEKKFDIQKHEQFLYKKSRYYDVFLVTPSSTGTEQSVNIPNNFPVTHKRKNAEFTRT